MFRQIIFSLMCAYGFLLQYTPHTYGQHIAYMKISPWPKLQILWKIFGNSHIQIDDPGIENCFETMRVLTGSADQVCTLFSIAVYLVKKDLFYMFTFIANGPITDVLWYQFCIPPYQQYLSIWNFIYACQNSV